VTECFEFEVEVVAKSDSFNRATRRVGRVYSIVALDRQTQNIAVLPPPHRQPPTQHYIVSAELRWDLRLAITCADFGPGYRAFTL
jgi:hypothetical protein